MKHILLTLMFAWLYQLANGYYITLIIASDWRTIGYVKLFYILWLLLYKGNKQSLYFLFNNHVLMVIPLKVINNIVHKHPDRKIAAAIVIMSFETLSICSMIRLRIINLFYFQDLTFTYVYNRDTCKLRQVIRYRQLLNSVKNSHRYCYSVQVREILLLPDLKCNICHISNDIFHWIFLSFRKFGVRKFFLPIIVR